MVLLEALIRWDNDKSSNVVPLSNLKLKKGCVPKQGTKVKMRWDEEWWHGTILDVTEAEAEAANQSENDQDVSDREETDDDDDNVPLATLGRHGEYRSGD